MDSETTFINTEDWKASMLDELSSREVVLDFEKQIRMLFGMEDEVSY